MTTTELIKNSALCLRAIEGVPLLVLAAVCLAVALCLRGKPLL